VRAKVGASSQVKYGLWQMYIMIEAHGVEKPTNITGGPHFSGKSSFLPQLKG